MRSPLTVRTENVPLGNGRVVILLSVPKGIDKPYFDKNGVIWLKIGADKRRVNSKEELRRLFQLTEQFHADELPTKAGIAGGIVSLPRCGDGALALALARNSNTLVHVMSGDPKLLEAKKIVYKEGFHAGKMNENCGRYSGLPVDKAKEAMKQDMLRSNQADLFFR